ncbi:unnamed protein product [Ixodes pacificus]
MKAKVWRCFMLHNLPTGDNSTRVCSPRLSKHVASTSFVTRKKKKKIEARWFSAGSRRRKLRTVGKTTLRSCEASRSRPSRLELPLLPCATLIVAKKGWLRSCG